MNQLGLSKSDILLFVLQFSYRFKLTVSSSNSI